VTAPRTRPPYTTTEDPAKYREWDRGQWPGEGADDGPGGDQPAVAGDAGSRPETATQPSDEGRWNKFDYVGESSDGRIPEPEAARGMSEGEQGRSGHRHTEEPAHWARPADEEAATSKGPA